MKGKQILMEVFALTTGRQGKGFTTHIYLRWSIALTIEFLLELTAFVKLCGMPIRLSTLKRALRFSWPL